MKLILEDIQKVEVDLIEPEITIVDRVNPSRSYKFSPIGGYLIIQTGIPINVEMHTSIKVILIENIGMEG
jgi:hypothetical protein